MEYLLTLANVAKSNINTDSLPKPEATLARLDSVLSLAFVLLGAIAVLIIVIAGFRYVISRGEPAEMARSKNTIIYALVGLGICILAYSIVTFVIKSV